MPIYEYACQDCTHEFEALTRTSVQPECPQCHSIQLKKKLSVFATAGAAEDRMPQMDASAPMGPCGTCGNPDGPGSCAWEQ